MTYTKYQHIEKIGNSDVDGILDGTAYLSYKIDGTNACIWRKDDGTLGFGSRNKELSLENKTSDNEGFMREMTTGESHKEELEDIKSFLKEFPECILYGEWLTPHTLRQYKDSAWRNFYVFDVLDTKTGKWINYDIYSTQFNTSYPHIHYIPIITRVTNATVEDIKGYLPRTNQWLIKEGTEYGEGIVIKNYDFTNRYGNRIWAKMLTEDFLNTKNKVRNDNRDAKTTSTVVERNIISLLTQEQVLKEKHKMEDANGGLWENSRVGELMGRVWHEFWHDNWEQIIIQRARNQTVNLKTLRNMSDSFVRKALGL